MRRRSASTPVELDRRRAGRRLARASRHRRRSTSAAPRPILSFQLVLGAEIDEDAELERAVDPGRRRRRRRRRRRHDRCGRERGLRPDVAGAPRPPGRAGPRGRRGQPAHRRRRQQRRPGPAALARRGRRHPAHLVPRPGVRQRPRRRAARHHRAGRPAAHHLAGQRGRPASADPDRRRRSPTTRASSSATAHYDRAAGSRCFPFGHGLGYTTFAFEDVEVEPTDAGAVGLGDVRNTGARPAATVVQVYASRPDSEIDRVQRWLVGFAGIELAPDTQGTVADRLPGARLPALGHRDVGAWALEPGTYSLQIGPSIASTELTGRGQAGLRPVACPGPSAPARLDPISDRLPEHSHGCPARRAARPHRRRHPPVRGGA